MARADSVVGGPSAVADTSSSSSLRARVRRHGLLVTAQATVGVGLVLLALISDVSATARLAGAAFALVVAALLVVGSLGDRAPGRGMVSLVGGSLGVVVGGGIALPWLAAAGLSLVALIMSGTLVAGVSLLAVGAWILIRVTPGRWRLLAIPVGFLLLQFVLMPLTMAVYGTHPPRTSLVAARPANAQDVSFRTADGVTLRAWYTPSENGVAIVLLPGSGGAKDSTLAHAEVLAEHGYGVLALDSRGTGESGGIGNAWGWHGVADIAAATSWLSQRPEVDADRIAAVGLSMGGEEAITAAAAGVPLGAVVAEGVSARAPADLEYLPTDPAGVTQRLMARIMWGAADLMTDASPPVRLRDALAQADDVPVLIIAGSDVDEALAAPYLGQASRSVELWSLEATPHIQSLSRHPDQWEARVIGFLVSSLG
jgi:uncharacterized protein